MGIRFAAEEGVTPHTAAGKFCAAQNIPADYAYGAVEPQMARQLARWEHHAEPQEPLIKTIDVSLAVELMLSHSAQENAIPLCGALLLFSGQVPVQGLRGAVQTLQTQCPQLPSTCARGVAIHVQGASCCDADLCGDWAQDLHRQDPMESGGPRQQRECIRHDSVQGFGAGLEVLRPDQAGCGGPAAGAADAGKAVKSGQASSHAVGLSCGLCISFASAVTSLVTVSPAAQAGGMQHQPCDSAKCWACRTSPPPPGRTARRSPCGPTAHRPAASCGQAQRSSWGPA